MDRRWDYLEQRKNIVVSSLPGNRDDSEFSERVWLAVLGTASRGGKCDVQFLISALQGQPRDCLFTPRRRQEFVSAITPLLEANEDVEGNVGCFLVAVQQFHNAALAANSGICRLGQPHALLYVAAGVALQYKLQNSARVCTLLKSIHDCDGGLDKILVPPLLGHRLTHVLSGWKPHGENGDNPQNVFFWTMHGTCAGLLVGSPPLRIQDSPLPSLQNSVPLTVAIQADNVKAVKYLLMCGAEVHGRDRHSPLLAALTKLSTFARASLSSHQACKCELKEDHAQVFCSPLLDTSYSLEMCPCDLQWPIAWPAAGVEILQRLLACLGRWRLPRNAEIVHPRIIADGLLVFPTLMQCCRVVIRKQLSNGWNLPQGASKLPLPKNLKKFITLQE